MLSAFIGNKMPVHINSPGGYCLRGCYLSGGSRTRTCDLWVMSPTSYHCSIPRYFCFASAKLADFSIRCKFMRVKKC